MSKDEVFQLFGMIANTEIIPSNEEFDVEAFDAKKKQYLERHIHHANMLIMISTENGVKISNNIATVKFWKKVPQKLKSLSNAQPERIAASKRT